jgi:hypothetical protein
MVFVESVLMVILATSPKKCESENAPVKIDSYWCPPVLDTGNPREVEVFVGDSLEFAIAKDFASVPEIRNVMTEQSEGPLLVWISVDDPVSEIRMRIYRKELELIDGFPEIDFDFNLLPSMGRGPEEIATGARVIYSRS